MLVLHLGVVDVPYSNGSYAPAKGKTKRVGQARRGNANAPHNAQSETQTTGDVAEILEDKYHIMEVFFEDVGAPAITRAIENSVSAALENLVAGAPANISPTAQAMSEIEAAFRAFLLQQEMDDVVADVPTQAALHGVSHRFKHPYAKRPERPSFIDTGLYETNFTAWVD